MTRATGHVRKQYEEPTPWQAMKVAPLDKAALAAKKAAAAAAAGKRAKNAAANPPKKQAQAEARRIRRRRGEVCFHCRKPGHRLAECPEANATVALPERKETAHAVVCYKCGSPDHTAKQCAKRDGGFAFAVCFVCKEQGHLSGQCPKNEHGLYPNGGGCKYCGSVNHYARDCRPTQPGKEGFTVSRLRADQNPEEDDAIEVLRRIDADRGARKGKRAAAAADEAEADAPAPAPRAAAKPAAARPKGPKVVKF